MVDTVHFNVKGGGVRTARLSAGCGVDCSACNTSLPAMPKKVSWHDGTAYPFVWSTFEPQNSLTDKACVQADELTPMYGVGVKQVPAGYTMYRLYVPPHSILRGLGVTHTKETDPYGLATDSFAGMIYDVVANEVTYNATTCQDDIGAVVAAAVPAAFADLVPSNTGTLVAPVAPATGGYVTGDKGLLIAIRVDVPPTVGLSNLRGSITLQANIETFGALVRGPATVEGPYISPGTTNP